MAVLKYTFFYQQVNYINAHATSTIVGDLAEVNALKKVFKDTSEIKMNGTKVRALVVLLLFSFSFSFLFIFLADGFHIHACGHIGVELVC